MNPIYASAVLALVILVSSEAKFTNDDAELICTSTGMKVKFNKTVLDSHNRPYKIHFVNTNSSFCMVSHNTTTHLMQENQTIWMQANFNQCAIAIHAENKNIVYHQTIAVTYGTNPRSSLVYREEKILFEAQCSKPSNLTLHLDGEYVNITSLRKVTFNKTNTAQFEISLKRTNMDFLTEDKSATLKINSMMYFKIALETSRSDLSVSPQSCYAHPANNETLKYFLIENRCPNKDDGTVEISNAISHPTVFLWQNQAFRFFGQSTDALYVSCDVVVCASNASVACQRCGESNKRRRRDVELDGETGHTMQTAKVTSPLIVLIDEPILAEPSPRSTGNIFSGTKGIAILVLFIVISMIGIVILVKKLSASGRRTELI